ncbi:C40 family peptidase [Crocinitomicaceae bacterium]|nr:C40 family peptidase [Crocinitomicaceae bacterium]
MKRIVVVLVLIFASTLVRAQNQQFDKLEMFFDQGHYKKVHRKAARLLDNPEYDFSLLPAYYSSISLLQLAQNKFWRTRHPKAMDRAIELFLTVKRSPRSTQLFDAHLYELSWLKNDLILWAADLKRLNANETFAKVQRFIDALPKKVPVIVEPVPIVKQEDSDMVITPLTDLTLREAVVLDAKKHIGTPYVWAGNTPEGFDCSGFTRYVMLQHGYELLRRAADQYMASRKIKEKHVQQGDLVFFDNGSGVSHVGIVAEVGEDQVVMIHASSSKGVILTEIKSSSYWSKRLKGYGSYFD